MIPTAKIVGPVCVGFLMFAIVFGFIDRERHAQMPQTDVAVVNAAAAQMEESQVVVDGTTSLTIIVPNRPFDLDFLALEVYRRPVGLR